VMGDHQDGLARMDAEQLIQSGGDSEINVGKGFSTRIALVRRVLHEVLISFRIQVADGLPIETFPAADIAFGQRIEWLRCKPMRRRHDGSGLHRTEKGATVAKIDRPDREKVPCGFSLADAQPSQRGIMAPTL